MGIFVSGSSGTNLVQSMDIAACSFSGFGTAIRFDQYVKNSNVIGGSVQNGASYGLFINSGGTNTNNTVLGFQKTSGGTFGGSYVHVSDSGTGTQKQWNNVGSILDLSGDPGASSLALDVAAPESTTWATYTNLTTPGPSVNATIGQSGLALVNLSATISNSGPGGSISYMSLQVDTGVPTDVDAARTASTVAGTVSRPILVTGLSPGSHAFTAKYRVSANTGTFAQRRLVVVPM
jgi:hypothetical protein